MLFSMENDNNEKEVEITKHTHSITENCFCVSVMNTYTTLIYMITKMQFVR